MERQQHTLPRDGRLDERLRIDGTRGDQACDEHVLVRCECEAGELVRRFGFRCHHDRVDVLVVEQLAHPPSSSTLVAQVGPHRVLVRPSVTQSGDLELRQPLERVDERRTGLLGEDDPDGERGPQRRNLRARTTTRETAPRAVATASAAEMRKSSPP